MGEMRSCKECANAIFDPAFGDYKCKILKRHVAVWYDAMDCTDYAVGKELVETKEERGEYDDF